MQGFIFSTLIFGFWGLVILTSQKDLVTVSWLSLCGNQHFRSMPYGATQKLTPPWGLLNRGFIRNLKLFINKSAALVSVAIKLQKKIEEFERFLQLLFSTVYSERYWKTGALNFVRGIDWKNKSIVCSHRLLGSEEWAFIVFFYNSAKLQGVEFRLQFRHPPSFRSPLSEGVDAVCAFILAVELKGTRSSRHPKKPPLTPGVQRRWRRVGGGGRR